MNRRALRLLPPVLYLCGSMLFGAGHDGAAGLLPVVTVSAKTMGGDGEISTAIVDQLGRLFVGSKSLLVFDGQAWRSFPMPKNNFLTSLNLGADGRLWAGAINELGYFQEPEPGVFQFHSLLSRLPEGAREVGLIWGCLPVGRATYFVGRNKLLRWDGTGFQTTQFATRGRLFPLQLAGEWCFYHLESGLYRLNEAGARLAVPASDLEGLRIIGLFQDEHGLVTVSSKGFVRPGNGNAVAPFSEPALNNYLGQHLVSSFGALPDGNLIIGTVSGGIVLASRAGQLIRTWNSNSGLPGRSIAGLSTSEAGEIFGIAGGNFFHFPSSGESTVFNSKNGLSGKMVNDFRQWGSAVYAVTDDGIYCQETAPGGHASFQAVPILTAVYSHMLPYHDGLLLSRFGAVDRFDGTTVQTVFRSHAGDLLGIFPGRGDPKKFYVPEPAGLAQMDEQPDGTFLGKDLAEFPEGIVSFWEDSAGRIWIGTSTKGAFTYDPTTGRLTPLPDPRSGESLTGPIKLLGNDRQILVFSDQGVLQADANGHSLRAIEGVPVFSPLDVQYLPNGRDIFITYQHPGGSNTLSSGTGVLTLTSPGKANWRELDIAALGVIGQVRTLAFSQENGRPILWLGGMEGVLRVDYDRVPTLQPPATPIIVPAMRAADSRGRIKIFPANEPTIKLLVFTGDYVRGKDWLIQTRLGPTGDEWSPPAPQRSFTISNLSDGEFVFEARAVNSAGMISPPASFSFKILPPWYRTNWAYAAYAAGVALFALGFVRGRERRIRTRNRALEILIEVRTEELMKANAAKEEFLANISHEIRNPLNGIIGIAGTFDPKSFDPNDKNKFALLRQCAAHLSALLGDILDYSRVQAEAFELEAQAFDLRELVESIAALTAVGSDHLGVPLEIAVSPTVPRLLTGDQRRIRQILLNFVSNAFKHAGRGQVCVTVWGKILGPGQTEVLFAVSDEGPGIPLGERERLFTRFERGRAAQRSQVSGTGLGLALCKVLADKMGGRVWLESEEGLGSCFYFSAPFATADYLVQPAAPLPPPHQAGYPTALVVDDEEYNRVALSGLLENFCFTVQMAADGPAACAQARIQEFDFIFLDYALPGRTGPEIARMIRLLPNRSARAVICAVTAFNSPEKKAQCLAAGMDDFLGKPVTMERLRQVLTVANRVGAVPPPLPPSGPGAPDPLGNLRQLAARKGVPFADELTLCLAELALELQQLGAALRGKDPGETGRCTHLACGRCGFLGERGLERALRQIEATAVADRWPEAQLLGQEAEALFGELRNRLALLSPVVPPASGR